MDLTANELLAKEHFTNLVTYGYDIPITLGSTTGFDFEFHKPNWFDPVKYELGRQFYFDNRAGVAFSNLAGLVLLLAVPTGLKIIHATGKSSTPATAMDRYIDTIVHVNSWFDYPLDNSTMAWESLKTVRKLHNHASFNGEEKKIGSITQVEVSMTTFGFAGFALIRPHIFAIKKASREKREGFLHLWAVINYMLGVRDEFNICLLPLEAAEIEFDLIMRNVLSPYIQVENPLFKHMVTALLDGLRKIMPVSDYESMLFMTRRAVGIPGYQYHVDLKLEKPPRAIFTEEELRSSGHHLFNNPNILIIEAVKKSDFGNSIESIDGYEMEVLEKMRIELDLPEDMTLRVREVPRDESQFMAALNNNEYKKLRLLPKLLTSSSLLMVDALRNPFTGFVVEKLNLIILRRMKEMQRRRSPGGR